jgi:hypothetical protein
VYVCVCVLVCRGGGWYFGNMYTYIDCVSYCLYCVFYCFVYVYWFLFVLSSMMNLKIFEIKRAWSVLNCLCGIGSKGLGGIGKSFSSDDLPTSEIRTESPVTAHMRSVAPWVNLREVNLYSCVTDRSGPSDGFMSLCKSLMIIYDIWLGHAVLSLSSEAILIQHTRSCHLNDACQ